jgi:hypothetical protein
MQAQANANPLLRLYRRVLGLFIAGLILSGLTAFPLRHELEAVCSIRGLDQPNATPAHNLDRWLLTIRDGLRTTYANYPWVAYGTDWLAFAHLVLALFFIGPFVDPIRNVWVLKAGLIACLLVLPLALIAGPWRGIPLGWRLIDCSFGVLGAIPLYCCLRLTRRLAAAGL